MIERPRCNPVGPVAGARREQTGLLGNGKRQSAAEEQDPTDLPSTHQFVRKRIPAAPKALAFAKRQFVNPAGGPKVFDVEAGGPAVLIEVPCVQRTGLGV